jgi:RNA polymerase primary sigma factor
MMSLSDAKPVSREEELEMFRKLHEGDESMRDAIFKANARLVPFIAKRLLGAIANNPVLDLEDLISAGNLGMLKAINLFDPDKGYKFTTYAYNWIFSFMERAICNNSNAIRIPVHMQERMRKIKKREKELEYEYNRELTYEEKQEIAKKFMKTDNELANYNSYYMILEPVSLNVLTKPNGEEGETELIDFIAVDAITPEMEYASTALREAIENAMKDCLPERSEKILRMRFGFETGSVMTLEEVGQVFGITRERVRQIETKSIRILRRNRKFRHLKDYIEG